MSASSGQTLSLALLIGNNHAGKRARALRFAESDVVKMERVLRELAGVRRRDIWLLKGQQATGLRRAMAKVGARIAHLRRKHGKDQNIMLFVYYSGHARGGRLLMGETSFSFHEMREFLRKAGADIRFAIIDACESGPLTLLKGLRHRKRSFPIPTLQISPTIKGEVLMSATGEKESAHEDPELRGGVFTHYLVSGLRGAADKNRDGFVTLEEIYQYTYIRSLERTILSVHGPQRAHFRKRLSGYGQLVLTSLSRPRSWLLLRSEVAGDFFIWDGQHKALLAEINKSKGQIGRIALSPGNYVLQWRRKGGIFSTKIALRQGQKLNLRMVGRRVAYWRKGATRGQVGDVGMSGKVGQTGEVGRWVSFEGQLDGPWMDIHYRMGFSGIARGMLHQGPGLSLHVPLGASGDDTFSLMFRVSYQNAQTQIQPDLSLALHLFHVDVGLSWQVFRQGVWSLGLGPRLRWMPTFQDIPSNAQRVGETILSFSYGVGLDAFLRVRLSRRWYLQLGLDGGLRFFDLAGQWTLRWTFSSALGFGLRF